VDFAAPRLTLAATSRSGPKNARAIVRWKGCTGYSTARQNARNPRYELAKRTPTWCGRTGPALPSRFKTADVNLRRVATASTGVQVVLILLLILAGLPALGACGWYWQRQWRDGDADRRRRMRLVAIGCVVATAGFTGVFTLALAH
jgi:hypothetical protein